jgi:hypothetical protein
MKPLCVVAVLSLLLAGMTAVIEAVGYEVSGGSYAAAVFIGAASVVCSAVLAHQAAEHSHAEAVLTLKTELDLSSRGEES